MKNYYELLEVSEKASPEVIKKAYTTLVKKYHPDLQPDGEKKAAEEKIKEINEAYEILSDKVKRANFDKKLQIQRVKEEQAKFAKMNNKQQNSSNTTYENNTTNYRQNENYAPQNDKSYSYYNKPQKRVIHKPRVKNVYDNNYGTDYNDSMNEFYNNVYNEAYNNAYNQAYINNLRNMGFDIKYERPFKEKIKIAFSAFCSILVCLVICFILWHIPPIKNYFINLYNNNDIIKFFVDLFISIFQSFKQLFNNPQANI